MELQGYRRPPLRERVFRDADGAVIPYGHRWPFEEGPPADAYSVTAHPDRFAPLTEVARALDAALPPANRPGGAGETIGIRITDFPGAAIDVAGHELRFPFCGCDACDEDVDTLAEGMEQLVEAVLAGRFASSVEGLRYWGDWGSSGWSGPTAGPG